MGVNFQSCPACTERGRIHARRWSGQQGKGERMDKRISQRTSGKLLAAAAAASAGLVGWGTAQQADASLIVDLRATAVSNAAFATISADKKTVTYTGTAG